MSLGMIKERLDGGYYRSPEAIVDDLELLCRNIAAYHPDSSEILEQAMELRDGLVRALRMTVRKRK
jgi:hypothetical protein